MCRHLAWLGAPVELGALLLDPPHSLLRQSYAPNDMRCSAVVNADGFGAGWYPTPDTQAAFPTRYRRAVPMWTDESFTALARGVHSGAVLAAVRSATPGMPVLETACAPFTYDRWLFSLNGAIAGWPNSVAGPAARLPVTDLLTLDAPVDSALVWALIRHRLMTGHSPASALRAVTIEVLATAPGSRLNLLITDGTRVAATAVHHSLWVRVSAEGVLVSSEPIDQLPGWQPVPDGHLLTATPSTMDIAPIPAEEP